MRLRSILELAGVLATVTLLSGCGLLRKKGDSSSDGGVLGALAALADGGTTAPTTPVVDTITFKKKNPAVGSSFVDTTSSELKLTVTAPKTSNSSLSEHMASKVDVLGTDNGRTILKVKVTYTEHAKSETNDTKTKTEASPVVGKAYLVEFKDKKLLVTDENHKKVSSKEEKVVRGDVDDVVGKPDPLLSELPDAPMKVGDQADSLSEALRDLLSGDDKIDFSGTSVKLREIATAGTEKVGTFDVKTTATVAGPAKVVFDLTGTMTVRESDAKLTAITLTGPVTLTAGSVKAAGTISASQTRTY